MHYYNEFDPQAAAWLQVLIDQHLIPEGVVDTRSIVEVTAADLGGFVQCHFFAGIGGWPLALQLAGVPASTRLWTGSCPCQPFSVAGEGKGIADERHLWPVFFNLIRACNPPLVFGEQVASAAVLGSSAKPSQRSAGKAVQPVWLDGVFADLESAGYACGSAVMAACSVSAPHIRQRCWWGAVRLADSDSQFDNRAGNGRSGRRTEFADGGANERMADSFQSRLEGHAGNGHDGNEPGRIGTDEAGSVAPGGESGGLGNTPSGGLGIIGDASLAGSGGHAHGSGERGGVGDSDRQSTGRHTGSAHATEAEHGTRDGDDHGFVDAGDGVSQFWNDSRWHPCRDGKYRRVPVEPVFQHVVNELSSRVDSGGDFSPEEISLIAEAAQRFPLANPEAFKVLPRGTVRPALLKGSGNAIVPQVAAEFIKAFHQVIAP